MDRNELALNWQAFLRVALNFLFGEISQVACMNWYAWLGLI
jgi:hypothetical protein